VEALARGLDESVKAWSSSSAVMAVEGEIEVDVVKVAAVVVVVVVITEDARKDLGGFVGDDGGDDREDNDKDNEGCRGGSIPTSWACCERRRSSSSSVWPKPKSSTSRR
jgi:hypothetical protein